MKKIISGHLASLQATEVLLHMGLGEIHVFPRQEHESFSQQPCEDIRGMVRCILKDDVVIEIEPINHMVLV
ncbi:hypothetical protein ACFLU2_02400 [Chloroflexota bacterium]